MLTKKPLFVVGVDKPKDIKEIDIEPIIYIDEIKKSIKNEIISIYAPNESANRFQLQIGGEKYACKFYNKEKDEFIGASMLSMYKLNEFFDRGLLPDYEDGNYFMKGMNKNE